MLLNLLVVVIRGKEAPAPDRTVLVSAVVVVTGEDWQVQQEKSLIQLRIKEANLDC